MQTLYKAMAKDSGKQDENSVTVTYEADGSKNKIADYCMVSVGRVQILMILV